MASEPHAKIAQPAAGAVGLLIIDMINDLEFPGADKLLPGAVAAAGRIRALRARAEAAGVPVVYVNDNFGMWHSEKSRIVEACGAPGKRGRPLVEALAPDDDDYFVIKPQLSGFYATNLAVLLPKLGVSRLILTGVAADICVLFTAADAHMRSYDLWVPRDTVASEDDRRAEWALAIMRDSLGAEIRSTEALALEAWVGDGP